MQVLNGDTGLVIDSGLLQTGIAYPNSYWGDLSRSGAAHNPFARIHMDASSVEFKGSKSTLDFNYQDYRLIGIITRD